MDNRGRLTQEQEGSIYEKYKFIINKKGSNYDIPYWELRSQGICLTGNHLNIRYIRGVTNDENWERQDGVLNEALLNMIYFDLKHKNKEVPNKHTSKAINLIEEAMECLIERQRERILNSTLNTNKI